MTTVYIKNSMKKRFKLYSDNTGLLNYIKRKFSVKNPNAKYMKWGQELVSCISPSFTFHHGLVLDVIKAIKEFDPTIHVDYSEIKDIMLPCSIIDPVIEQPINETYIYHDYQEESIRLGLKFGRGVFELATSAGKSLIIYGLIVNYLKNLGEKKFLILVPGKQHVAQMAGDLIDYGMNPEDVCLFTAEGEREYKGQKVIITNTAWLLLHNKKLPEIDICMIDEAHGLKPGNKISTYVSKLKTHMKFGFTGTLSAWQPEAWNTIGLTGTVLKKIRAKELQDRGFVAINRMIGVKFMHNKKLKTPPDLVELMRLAEEDGRPEIIGEVRLEIAKARFPTEWRYIEGCEWTNNFMARMMCSFPGNTVILYDHTAHGDVLYEMVKSIAPNRRIYRIDGSVPLAYREMVRREMELHDDCILLGNTKCVAVGISIKNIDNIGFCFSSGTSAQKIIQAIGRGLRLRPGKKDVRIIDFWHDHRYSIKHFNERVKMYVEHYDIGMENIIHKNVPVIVVNDINKL